MTDTLNHDEQQEQAPQQAQETQEAERVIVVDDGSEHPELNPNDPAFDMAKWKAAIDAAGGMEVMTDNLQQTIKATNDQIRATVAAALHGGILTEIMNSDRNMLAALAPRIEELQKTAVEAMRSSLDTLVPRLEEIEKTMRGTLAAWAPTIREINRNFSEWKAKNLTGDTEQSEAIWEILEPYIDAEAEARPDLYDDRPARELIAAAAAAARADGKEIPPLRAEQPDAEPLDLAFPTEGTGTNKEKAPQGATEPAAEGQPAEPSPLAMARNAGAITTLGGHVATIAGEYFRDIFTSRNLSILPGQHDDFSFDVKGRLNELSLNGQPLQPLDDPHTGFLMALLQMAYDSDIREVNTRDNPNIGIYLPAFFRETGIDPRPRERDKATKELKKRTPAAADDQSMKDLRRNKFIEFMNPLDSRVGVIEGEGYYTLARFSYWDEKTDTAYISIPYEIKLVELAKLHADKHSAISTIFHADIMTENQAAVELANRIAVGLIERGVTRSQADTYKSETPRKAIRKTTTRTEADGTKTTETLTYQQEPDPTPAPATPRPRIFRWESRFDTLIAACPQLQGEVDAIRSSGVKDKSQRVNKKLKDVFTAAIRIIMEKSDVPNYYADIQITTGRLGKFKAPTNSTLTDKLVITHRGKNPNYVG